MSKVALVVDFDIKPGNMDGFLEVMRAHVAGTLAEEEGCLQFDILRSKEAENRILLYEVYRNDDAFKIHAGSDRLVRTRAAYEDMIVDRTITMCVVDG
jgi:quinol monooxygenase YgiN